MSISLDSYSLSLYTDCGQLSADADLCKYLLKCLSTHPDVRSKVAEIFATLAREGSGADTRIDVDTYTRICDVVIISFVLFCSTVPRYC